MGSSVSTGGVTGNDKQNHVQSSGGDVEPMKYRNSMRRVKRPKLTASTIDTRSTKISRGCVRPHVTAGSQWEDPCFPREMAMEGSSLERRNYRWMRPKDFMATPTLVHDTPSRHDVIQGSLGNCWLMATLAGIADHLPALLQIVGSVDYNPMCSGYDGVFHCRLWHYGQWVDVYVDDCLPVRSDHSAPKKYSLIGARSPDHNVLWVALVEKALAKFHGSYKGIESREREYGWRLLTGGVSVILDQEKLRRTASDEMFMRIKTAYDNGCIITCSRTVRGEHGERRHAYTVTGARKHSTKGNIIRIRNPWGEETSKITWLDKPQSWTYSDEEDAADFECKEGEFWVMRGECYREFTQFCIGCFKADYYDETEKQPNILNHKYTYYGEWTGDTAAGHDKTNIFNNPKFQIKIPGRRTTNKKILLELSPRPVDDQGVCLMLYKITKHKTNRSILCEDLLHGKPPCLVARGRPQYKHSLVPGTYMAVPVTMNQHEEREFCLRIYSNSKITSKTISGTCFHYNTEGKAAEPSKVLYFPGCWTDIYMNQESFPSVIHKIPQYHIKTSSPTRLSLYLLQDYKTRNDEIGLWIYELADATNVPLTRDFIEKEGARPTHRPNNMRGSQLHTNIDLKENTSYMLLAFPWTSTRTTHYVLVMEMDKTSNIHCSLLNKT